MDDREKARLKEIREVAIHNEYMARFFAHLEGAIRDAERALISPDCANVDFRRGYLYALTGVYNQLANENEVFESEVI